MAADISYQVLASCIPVLDADGNAVSLTGYVLNITAQKSANLSLIKRAQAFEMASETEERFKAFANDAPAGIYMFNRERQLVYCNSTFLEMMGAPPGQDPAVFVYSDHIFAKDLQRVSDAFEHVLAEGKPLVHEFRVNRLWQSIDGTKSEAWVNAVSFAVLDDRGNVKHGQGLLFDISSLKWASTFERTSKEMALEAATRQQAFNDSKLIRRCII